MTGNGGSPMPLVERAVRWSHVTGRPDVSFANKPLTPSRRATNLLPTRIDIQMCTNLREGRHARNSATCGRSRPRAFARPHAIRGSNRQSGRAVVSNTKAATYTDLWAKMLRIRHFEARVSELSEGNALPGYAHTYSGEEAVACGVIPLLRPTDWITSTYRNHGHSIARGVPLWRIASEIYGRADGVCSGKGGSMHAVDQSMNMIGGMGIVAGGLPIAAGAAFGAAFQGRDDVAVAFFGDGAVHQGAWHEALDFAAMFSAPVIFVCENNLYAETTAVEYHLRTPSVAAMTVPYGIKSATVDGMDVLAVREVAESAIERARAGSGPFLLEAMTYRYNGQFEGDTQTYKPPDEVAYWRQHDPLLHYRQAIVDRSWATTDELDRIDAEVRAEVDAAFRHAASAPWPEVATLLTDVYTISAGEDKA